MISCSRKISSESRKKYKSLDQKFKRQKKDKKDMIKCSAHLMAILLNGFRTMAINFWVIVVNVSYYLIIPRWTSPYINK